MTFRIVTLHRARIGGAPAIAMALLACGATTAPAPETAGGSPPEPSAAGPETCCPIVELRQYTLHPGQRDTLIELFDREFIETQEATGMTIVGQFRDLANPDRFVWLRGFPDMTRRAAALRAFYSGPTWKAHRQAANATMIDAANVLLLHPARPTSGFALASRTRPPVGAAETRTDLVAITIYSAAARLGDDFTGFFEQEVAPILAETGAAVEATFVTEESPNTFPALAIREGEHVFVWLTRFPDRAARDRHAAALAASARWSEVATALQARLSGPPVELLVAPTARSRW
jgi:quinol monooxygenase YgiN